MFKIIALPPTPLPAAAIVPAEDRDRLPAPNSKQAKIDGAITALMATPAQHVADADGATYIQNMIDATRTRVDAINTTSAKSAPTIRRLNSRILELEQLKAKVVAGDIKIIKAIGWGAGCFNPAAGPATTFGKKQDVSQFEGIVFTYTAEPTKPVYRKLGSSYELMPKENNPGAHFGQLFDAKIASPRFYARKVMGAGVGAGPILLDAVTGGDAVVGHAQDFPVVKYLHQPPARPAGPGMPAPAAPAPEERYRVKTNEFRTAVCEHYAEVRDLENTRTVGITLTIKPWNRPADGDNAAWNALLGQYLIEINTMLEHRGIGKTLPFDFPNADFRPDGTISFPIIIEAYSAQTQAQIDAVFNNWVFADHSLVRGAQMVAFDETEFAHAGDVAAFDARGAAFNAIRAVGGRLIPNQHQLMPDGGTAWHLPDGSVRHQVNQTFLFMFPAGVRAAIAQAAVDNRFNFGDQADDDADSVADFPI